MACFSHPRAEDTTHKAVSLFTLPVYNQRRTRRILRHNQLLGLPDTSENQYRIRTAGPAIRTIVPVAAEENLLQFQLRELVCASRPVPKHFGWIAPSIYENRRRASRQTGSVTRTALRADVRQRFSRSFYDALRSPESPRAPRRPSRCAGQLSQYTQRDPQFAPSPQPPPKRTRRNRPKAWP